MIAIHCPSGGTRPSRGLHERIAPTRSASRPVGQAQRQNQRRRTSTAISTGNPTSVAMLSVRVATAVQIITSGLAAGTIMAATGHGRIGSRQHDGRGQNRAPHREPPETATAASPPFAVVVEMFVLHRLSTAIDHRGPSSVLQYARACRRTFGSPAACFCPTEDRGSASPDGPRAASDRPVAPGVQRVDRLLAERLVDQRLPNSAAAG